MNGREHAERWELDSSLPNSGTNHTDRSAPVDVSRSASARCSAIDGWCSPERQARVRRQRPPGRETSTTMQQHHEGESGGPSRGSRTPSKGCPRRSNKVEYPTIVPDTAVRSPSIEGLTTVGLVQPTPLNVQRPRSRPSWTTAATIFPRAVEDSSCVGARPKPADGSSGRTTATRRRGTAAGTAVIEQRYAMTSMLRAARRSSSVMSLDGVLSSGVRGASRTEHLRDARTFVDVGLRHHSKVPIGPSRQATDLGISDLQGDGQGLGVGNGRIVPGRLMPSSWIDGHHHLLVGLVTYC